MSLLADAEANIDIYLNDDVNRKANETDREFIVRMVLFTAAGWLQEQDTEVELAMEMVKDGTEVDLSEARAAVRRVCDLVYEAIERRTGWIG